ncbi:aminoacyl-tRNA hydrolase [candidate division KSB3 bacterium]|uniref:Peptidyl-tRNA hydrolase n=1 Tax=candidate division KSB3 bacterium TaxID=2044937 RepID=A0A2G6E4Q6_9BACT|nr:MAG: aminoacyl-tRNA hydrolase [candidate division KSB3 bacterium]PIE29648.1 MAG: aminoacyl-tRNA hydrolase [candidate division KSB3 bacterium]
MWCIVGLGNPGKQYADTRHNVGFMLTDLLAERYPSTSQQRTASSRIRQTRVHGHSVLLIQPLTYMNLSGLAVAELLDRNNASPKQLIVVYDDLDLPPGLLRIRLRGGHGGHKGVKSIIENLDTDAFIRIRIGIGHPRVHSERELKDHCGGRGDVVDYVLQAFQQDEIGLLREVLHKTADAIALIVTGKIEHAMNLYNRR